MIELSVLMDITFDQKVVFHAVVVTEYNDWVPTIRGSWLFNYFSNITNVVKSDQ